MPVEALSNAHLPRKQANALVYFQQPGIIDPNFDSLRVHRLYYLARP